MSIHVAHIIKKDLLLSRAWLPPNPYKFYVRKTPDKNEVVQVQVMSAKEALENGLIGELPDNNGSENVRVEVKHQVEDWSNITMENIITKSYPYRGKRKGRDYPYELVYAVNNLDSILSLTLPESGKNVADSLNKQLKPGRILNSEFQIIVLLDVKERPCDESITTDIEIVNEGEKYQTDVYFCKNGVRKNLIDSDKTEDYVYVKDFYIVEKVSNDDKYHCCHQGFLDKKVILEIPRHVMKCGVKRNLALFLPSNVEIN